MSEQAKREAPAGARPPLAVVVACHIERGAVEDALTGSLGTSLAAHVAELEPTDELVVVAATDEPAATRATLEARWPRAHLLTAPRATLTPSLWRIGLVATQAAVVRVTIDAFVPEAGWRRALLEAVADGAVAVGGPMAADPGLRPSELALYLQRYRAWGPPLAERATDDVPGDHAGYTREALAETAELWREGFWERDVNRVLHRAGRLLRVAPGFAARYVGGEPAGRFFVHRWRHGIQFGRARAAEQSAGRRLLHAVLFVVPGMVFGARVVRESLAAGHPTARVARALPWLAAFVLAWSAGEWVGALAGLAGGRRGAH